jgi:hypothetical protein
MFCAVYARQSSDDSGRNEEARSTKTPNLTETVHLRRRSGRGRLHGRHTLLVQV